MGNRNSAGGFAHPAGPPRILPKIEWQLIMQHCGQTEFLRLARVCRTSLTAALESFARRHLSFTVLSTDPDVLMRLERTPLLKDLPLNLVWTHFTPVEIRASRKSAFEMALERPPPLFLTSANVSALDPFTRIRSLDVSSMQVALTVPYLWSLMEAVPTLTHVRDLTLSLDWPNGQVSGRAVIRSVDCIVEMMRTALRLRLTILGTNRARLILDPELRRCAAEIGDGAAMTKDVASRCGLTLERWGRTECMLLLAELASNAEANFLAIETLTLRETLEHPTPGSNLDWQTDLSALPGLRLVRVFGSRFFPLLNLTDLIEQVRSMPHLQMQCGVWDS